MAYTLSGVVVEMGGEAMKILTLTDSGRVPYLTLRTRSGKKRLIQVRTNSLDINLKIGRTLNGFNQTQYFISGAI